MQFMLVRKMKGGMDLSALKGGLLKKPKNILFDITVDRIRFELTFSAAGDQIECSLPGERGAKDVRSIAREDLGSFLYDKIKEALKSGERVNQDEEVIQKLKESALVASLMQEERRKAAKLSEKVAAPTAVNTATNQVDTYNASDLSNEAIRKRKEQIASIEEECYRIFRDELLDKHIAVISTPTKKSGGNNVPFRPLVFSDKNSMITSISSKAFGVAQEPGNDPFVLYLKAGTEGFEKVVKLPGSGDGSLSRDEEEMRGRILSNIYAEELKLPEFQELLRYAFVSKQITIEEMESISGDVLNGKTSQVAEVSAFKVQAEAVAVVKDAKDLTPKEIEREWCAAFASAASSQKEFKWKKQNSVLYSGAEPAVNAMNEVMAGVKEVFKDSKEALVGKISDQSRFNDNNGLSGLEVRIRELNERLERSVALVIMRNLSGFAAGPENIRKTIAKACLNDIETSEKMSGEILAPAERAQLIQKKLKEIDSRPYNKQSGTVDKTCVLDALSEIESYIKVATLLHKAERVHSILKHSDKEKLVQANKGSILVNSSTNSLELMDGKEVSAVRGARGSKTPSPPNEAHAVKPPAAPDMPAASSHVEKVLEGQKAKSIAPRGRR